MKKENVIDLTAYREELARKSTESAPVVEISEELKSAIEELIDRLRTHDPAKIS